PFSVSKHFLPRSNYIPLQKIARIFPQMHTEPIAAGGGFYDGDGLALLPKSHIKTRGSCTVRGALRAPATAHERYGIRGPVAVLSVGKI
ncbi:MAG: hypothetical protein AAAC47_29030, partial [Pararhizobium sp.]